MNIQFLCVSWIMLSPVGEVWEIESKGHALYPETSG